MLYNLYVFSAKIDEYRIYRNHNSYKGIIAVACLNRSQGLIQSARPRGKYTMYQTVTLTII